MSTIETKTLQTDKIIAADGSEVQPVEIPSLTKSLAFAYANVTYGKIANSMNISSIIVGSKTFTLSFLRPSADKNYSLVGTRNGAYTSNFDYTVEIQLPKNTKESFQVSCKAAGTATTNVDNFNVVLFRNNSLN